MQAQEASGRKAKREAKKREREERKLQLKADRERAREERLKAIEQRRAARAAAKAAKAPGATSPSKPEPATAVTPTVPPGEASESGGPGLGVAAGAAAAAAAAAAGAAAISKDDAPKAGGDTPAGSPLSEIDAEQRLHSAEGREDEAVVQARTAETEAEADRRVRALDQLRVAAEGRIAENAMEGTDAARRDLAPPEGDSLLANELRLTDAQIERRRQRDQELLAELANTESRIESNRERTEQAIEDARARLEQIESQAGEAEQRAARAEHLAELRKQEAERERRLHEMLEKINEAENRAREAEMRAREAVAGVAVPLDVGSPLPLPLPPDPDPEPISKLAESKLPKGASRFLMSEEPDSTPGVEESGVLPGSRADREPEAPEASSDVVPEHEGEGAVEPEQGTDDAAAAEPTETNEPAAPSESVSLNSATFEQLRNAGLSVTQTGRVLAHRERAGGFRSVDELDAIPGFPEEFLAEVRPRLTT